MKIGSLPILLTRLGFLLTLATWSLIVSLCSRGIKEDKTIEGLIIIGVT